MKNRFLSLGACGVIFLSAQVFSQITYRPGVFLGLSIFNETVTALGTALPASPKIGVSGGAVFEMELMHMVSIEPGIVYSQRGAKLDGGKLKDKLSYLTIPVNAKLKIPATPDICPYILAGINTGVLMSATSDSINLSTNAKKSFNSKDSLNLIDIGLDFGAGFEMNLPKIVPYIEYVYYVGLANIWKNAPYGASGKNHGSEIKAGLKYKL
jgi:hypothetical protein